jgi:hypothetical protein
MLHFHVINFYNILGLWMIVLPVWEIGSPQSIHLHGTTQTIYMESSVRAQGEFEMVALFQSGRRQRRPLCEAAVPLAVLINWICHSSDTLPTAAHNTQMLSLCILKPLIYAIASVPVCCTFQYICCGFLWTFILMLIVSGRIY